MAASREDTKSSAAPDAKARRAALHRRHLRVGWFALLVFITLGAVLEALHGFKVGWYLSVANEVRRLTWTLAHTHGTLLGLVNLGFAATVLRLSATWRGRDVASACLLGATALLPLGFLLGGLVIHAGDPGKGILLVPVGAALLIVAVALTALATLRLRE